MAIQGKQLANATVPGSKLENGAVDTTQLADGAVTEVKIGAAAVTEAKIGTGAVTETKIGTGAVTSDKIGAAAVIEAKIGTGAVTADKIGTDAVTNSKIATGAVDTDELATAAVTPAKADLTQTWSFATGNLQVTGDPSNDNDVARKAYVDTVAQGLIVKESCRLVTAAALAAYTPAGSGVGKTLTANANGALSVDGIAVAVNDRILVKDEGAGTSVHNGIYVVTQTGDGSNPWILTRSTDFDGSPAGEVKDGNFTFIGEGNTLSHTGWVLTTADPITVDTTPLTFQQFSGAGSYTAGQGLDLSGNSFYVAELADSAIDVQTTGSKVAVDNSTIEITAGTPGSINVKAAGINENHLNATVAGDGLTGGAGSPLAVNTGNGLTTSGDAVTVQADAVAGPNLATAIDVNANGVAIGVDDVTIEDNGSDQLRVKDAGITEAKIGTGAVTEAKIGTGAVTVNKIGANAVTAAKIDTSVAGDGIDGGGGTALSVNVGDIAGTGLESDGGSPANLRIASAAAGNGLTGGSGSALAVQANGDSILVGASGVSAAVPSVANKHVAALTTTSDEDPAVASGITGTPAGNSYPQVMINGVQEYVGNGTKTGVSCYFANPATPSTPRAFADIAAGDKLYWQGTNAGYELEATVDYIDINFVVV